MKSTFILVSMCASIILASCSTDRNKERKSEKFPITNPIIVDTTFTQEYIADIHAIQNVEIRSRIKGFIDKIHVDEGKNVEAGQLLFTLSSKAFRQDLIKAKAQLKSTIAQSKIAEVELNNTKILVDKKIVSSSELEMAVAKLEAVKAKIEEDESAILSAELNISFASIRAPFGGVINRLPLKTGSLVAEGTLLTSISNNKEVFAYFNLSEKEYLQILKAKGHSQEQVVKLQLADGELFKYTGQIETAESEIDKNTGSLAFRARFKNPDRFLKHGSSGKILLVNNLSKAMLIPQKATFEIQENNYVYVIDKNNKVQTRSIIIKKRLPHLYVVESGLSVDDHILFEGIQRVKQGQTITSELIPMKTIMRELGSK